MEKKTDTGMIVKMTSANRKRAIDICVGTIVGMIFSTGLFVLGTGADGRGGSEKGGED